MSNRVPYTVKTMRAPNNIVAHPQRIESKDGTRWACGRNVKRSLGNRTYDGVEVWALKHRVNGKVVVVATHRGREDADLWINGGTP